VVLHLQNDVSSASGRVAGGRTNNKGGCGGPAAKNKEGELQSHIGCVVVGWLLFVFKNVYTFYFFLPIV